MPRGDSGESLLHCTEIAAIFNGEDDNDWLGDPKVDLKATAIRRSNPKPLSKRRM
jgi:hypothetical protein